MNFFENSKDAGYKIDFMKKSSKNKKAKDILKIMPSNQLTITSSKNSNSNIYQTHISTFGEEEIEKNEEEEEINSDEYISSTNLDVETNTYIYDEKNSESINLDIINQKGRLKPDLNELKNKNQINNIFINNMGNYNKTINIEKQNFDKNNIINNKNIFNNNDIIKKGHRYFKSEVLDDINKRQCSTNKGQRVIITPNSIERNGIFTPNNKEKKAMNILKGIINKNINSYHLKELNTITFPENNLKSMNNNKRKNIINATNNNINRSVNMTNNTNNNRNVQIKNIKQKNIQNNNININIYNKNIIKDMGGIKIDGQKYHLIPQTNKKVKTQGRMGKIMNNNQNKKNNFVYIINTKNNNTTFNNNNVINSPNLKKNNTTINNNRITSPNNSINTNKIKIEQRKNVHNIKNLKTDNIQKTIHKYLLENKYLTILPSSPNQRKNLREVKTNK